MHTRRFFVVVGFLFSLLLLAGRNYCCAKLMLKDGAPSSFLGGGTSAQNGSLALGALFAPGVFGAVELCQPRVAFLVGTHQKFTLQVRRAQCEATCDVCHISVTTQTCAQAYIQHAHKHSHNMRTSIHTRMSTQTRTQAYMQAQRTNAYLGPAE